MVTSFHAESESGGFDDAPRRPAPEPEDVAPGGWNPLLEVRPVTPTDFLKGVFTDCLWVRSAAPLGEDLLLHRAGLTYLSDLGTGFGQQDRSLIGRGGPSIDHSVWFQENIRADDWVLVDLRPVKARSARGSYHGSLRDRRGVLGATIYQEQLLLPGSMADLVAEVRCGRRPSWRHVEGRPDPDQERATRPRGSTRPDADVGRRRGVRPPSGDRLDVLQPVRPDRLHVEHGDPRLPVGGDTVLDEAGVADERHPGDQLVGHQRGRPLRSPPR